MNIFQAVVYGIVQGLGEFLPISSTAHLILVPWLFGWNEPDLSFDVALHVGTLAAVGLYFWKDWIRLLKAGVKGTKTTDGKIFWFLVIATIPGAIFGKLFEHQVESSFRNPALIGVMLMSMGVILYMADYYGRKNVSLERIGLGRSIIIGLSQALALIPGTSRSGATMSAGLLTGLDRESVARFSFYLSAPIILGGAILKVGDLIHPKIGYGPMIAGILTSGIVGALSIKFLLDYLKKKGFGIFVAYRLIFGAIIIALYLMRL